MAGINCHIGYGTGLQKRTRNRTHRSRVEDAVGSKRIYVPLGISVMVHLVALSYLSVLEIPEEPPPPSTEISLRQEEPPPAKPPPAPPPPEPVPPPIPPAADRARKTRRGTGSDEANLPASKGAVGPDSSAPTSGPPTGFSDEGPPRPAGLPRIPSIFDSRPGEQETEGPAIEREVRRPQEKKPVDPIYGQPDSIAPGTPDPPANGGSSLATGDGRAGGGIGFDFWAPPVFAEEIAKAESKILPAEETLQQEKTADLGHGVICNTEGFWFICAHESINACNAAHEDMCRFAKWTDRRDLLTPVIF